MALALAALAVLLRPIHGVWESVGYGLIWSFEGAGLATFEVTTTTCVASTSYRFEAPADPGVQAVPGADEGVRAGSGRHDVELTIELQGSKLIARSPIQPAGEELLPLSALKFVSADRGYSYEEKATTAIVDLDAGQPLVGKRKP